MVERKLKGVLVVLSIFVVMLLSLVVVSAGYSCGTPASSTACNNIWGSPTTTVNSASACESWCESQTTTGANCCSWISSTGSCYLGTQPMAYPVPSNIYGGSCTFYGYGYNCDYPTSSKACNNIKAYTSESSISACESWCEHDVYGDLGITDANCCYWVSSANVCIIGTTLVTGPPSISYAATCTEIDNTCTSGSDCDSGLCVEGECGATAYSCPVSPPSKRCSGSGSTSSYTTAGNCAWDGSKGICDMTGEWLQYNGNDNFYSECGYSSVFDRDDCDKSVGGSYSANGVCCGSNCVGSTSSNCCDDGDCTSPQVCNSDYVCETPAPTCTSNGNDCSNANTCCGLVCVEGKCRDDCSGYNGQKCYERDNAGLCVNPSELSSTLGGCDVAPSCSSFGQSCTVSNDYGYEDSDCCDGFMCDAWSSTCVEWGCGTSASDCPFYYFHEQTGNPWTEWWCDTRYDRVHYEVLEYRCSTGIDDLLQHRCIEYTLSTGEKICEDDERCAYPYSSNDLYASTLQKDCNAICNVGVNSYVGCYGDGNLWNYDDCGDRTDVSDYCTAIGESCQVNPGENDECVIGEGYDCPDGTIAGDEVCDGSNLGGNDCTTVAGDFDAGTLSCNTNCLSFNTNSCTDCGDNNQEGSETCDGSDLNGATCTSLNYDAGTLSCNSVCTGFITSGCYDYECTSDSNCNSNEKCSSSHTCVACDLTGAWWSPGDDIGEGTSVSLAVEGNWACAGKTVDLDVYRGSTWIRDLSSLTIGSSSPYRGYRSWTSDVDNSGDHDFVGTLDSNTGEKAYSGNIYITVAPPPASCGDGICQENCGTCSQDCLCPGQVCHSNTCMDDCVITNAYWSSSSVNDGDSVTLNVQTTGCTTSETISFNIFERDILDSNDDYSPDPSAKNVESDGTTSRTWVADWTDDSALLESNPPEYRFTASISAWSESDTSGNLEVNSVSSGATCGDGDRESGEGCDDGNTASSDGCSSTCSIESGWKCNTNEPNNVCWWACGDGIRDSTEQCDDDDTANGDGCSSSCQVEDGYSCVGDVGDLSVCSEAGCMISVAEWQRSGSTITSVNDNVNVYLHVETPDCPDGTTIEFYVTEDDNTFDDLVSTSIGDATISSNMADGIWNAEYMSDTDGDGNPPEFYFTANIQGDTTERDSGGLLTVNYVNPCAGISTCADYSQSACEADGCGVADASQANCDFQVDPVSRCILYNDCGCEWDGSSCVPSLEITPSCGECGNTVLDSGETCDDGNIISGDGCSATCTIEDDISLPCPEGTTRCADDTCSLNCWFTDGGNAPCNNDGTCDSDEGCSCGDCDGVNDACGAGLLCSINDEACCYGTEDGSCNPYCSFIDPDCAGDDYCGNGWEGFGEQCDDGNTNNTDGCSNTCTYNIVPIGGDCLEGQMLCLDGTCSLNCGFTDIGYDDSCQLESANCCAEGLSYRVQDNACCKVISDGYCSPYCAISDPDCNALDLGGINGIGYCAYSDNSLDDCADGFLTRDYTANWIWDDSNFVYVDPQSTSYVEDPAGEWHYDPINPLTGDRASDDCNNISDEIICPAQVELPGFGKMQLILSIIVLAIAYTIIIFRRRD